MLGINSIIGAGIFLTPGEVIGLAGPFAPMAYVLAGIFAGVVAIVFATAARYVRTNGASYAYTTAAFGRRIGIYVGVTHAITASIAWGVLASFFVSTLLRVAFPDKAWADAEQLFSVKTLTFLGFIGVLLAINLFGNRAIKWANGTSTVGKAFALSAFIVGGLWIITTQHVNNYATAWSAYSATPYSLLGVAEIGKGTFSSMALATIVALYAFTGFESIANAAEEMDAPDRNLPRAIPIAIFSVGAIYLLTLTVAMLLGSNKIAASGDTVKLAAAIGNATFRTIIVVGALISMFGINVAASFGAPRLWTALADSGVLPTRLSRKNQYDVPMVSFAITASLALAFPLALRFDNLHLDRPGGDRPIRPVHHRADRSHRIGEVSGSRTCCCAAKCVHRQGVTACCDRGLGWAGSVLRLPLHLSSAGWSELLLDCFDRDHVHRGTGDGLSALLPNHSPGWRSAEHSLDSVGAELERENTTASDGGNSLVGAGKISTCIPGSAARASVCNAEGL